MLQHPPFGAGPSTESSLVACTGFARIVWFFFIAAHAVLWFELVIKTALVAQACFSWCRTVLAQRQGFLHFSLRPCSKWTRLGGVAGVDKRLGVDTAETANPS